MNFLNKIKGIFAKEKESYSLEELSQVLNSYGIDSGNVIQLNDLSETIYFICLKHLSETMAKMPWEKRILTETRGMERVIDKRLSKILNLRPNPYMSAITFWGCVELNKLHTGNSFVYIEADRNGFPKHLWLLPSEEIQIWINNKGILGSKNLIWYVWLDKRTGKQYRFEYEEIIHLKTHITFDGLVGMPIRDILKTQINTGKSSIAFLNKLYKSNMFGSKVIVHYTGELKKGSEGKIAEKLEEYSASQGSGKFIPMPLGMQAQLLDMKLADAQFFENNKISALQLAAAFGIKPNVINDYTKSSYSNSETQQVDFYVNTLQPLFKGYEQEITHKILTEKEIEEGYRLEINEKILFKMDNKTQAEVYSKYLTNFAMTPNEVREDLNLPYVVGGDTLIGNGASINLENIGSQYKGGEKDANIKS